MPWLAGAGGLLVYCLTLNKWVSLLNLGTVTRISGWGWRPELGQPLTWILLYPFRWLPEPAIPPALNLFAAVCGALVLVVPTIRSYEEAIKARDWAFFPPLGKMANAWPPKEWMTPAALMPRPPAASRRELM